MTTTRHEALCCLCGAHSDLMHRERGHRFCPACVSWLSREVSDRVERGATPRPGQGVLEGALLDILEERTCACVVQDVPLCPVLPMRLMLVAGFHQRDQPREWILITRDGELTSDVLYARLLDFTAKGSALALVCAKKWTDVLGRDCALSPFVARVLVVGNPDDPEEVIEGWRFEGDAPTDQKYRFDE